MADHDKGGMDPTRSSGTQPPTPPIASAGSATSGAGTSDRTDSGAGMNKTGERVANEARHYAEDMAGRVKERGRAMFEQQKGVAAGQVDSVASAFRNTAGHLQQEGQSQTGHYVEMVAERLESLGEQLRHKDVGTLIGDAEDLGRRAPGAFFAGSVVAGFLFARFLKSSSERRRETMGMSQDERSARGFPPPQPHDRSAAMSTAYGSPASASRVSDTGSGIDASANPSGSVAGSSSAASEIPTPPTGTSAGSAGPSGPLGTPSSPSGSNPGGNSYGNR